MNKDVEIRKTALETLIQIEKNNSPSHLVLKDVLDKYDYLSKTEKALISTIVKGSPEIYRFSPIGLMPRKNSSMISWLITQT